MSGGLRRRVLALWTLALLAAGGAGVGAASLRESQWRAQLDATAQLPLEQAWAAASRQAQQALRAAIDTHKPVVGASGDAGAPRLAQAAAAAGLVQIDLYDTRGQLRASSSAAREPQPLVDAGSLQLLLRSDGVAPPRAGVRLRDASHEAGGAPALYVLAQRLGDGSVLAAALDLRALLHAAGQDLGATLALVSPRGLLLTGLPPPSGQALQLALPGLDGNAQRPAALLLAPRPAAAQAPLPGWALAGWLALLPLVFIASLWFALRRLVAPLLAPVRRVEALAAGRLQPAADDEDTLASVHADGEAARLARAAERLRTELRALDALRDERQRVAAQQTRLIRQQLRRLAGTLDEAARAEVMAELGDEGTGDGRPQLARLATLLERLISLVGSQQTRLLALLRELQDSVRTRELFASLQQELEIARRLQLAILPRTAPPLPQLRLLAAMIPAREVGGDFHDWFMLDAQHLALVVADVSGKGVPAAFFMAVARTRLRSIAAFVDDPARLVAQLNDELAAENDESLFVTLFLAVLDLASGELVCVNAGHNPPLLRRADGRVQALPSGRNPVLAAFGGLAFAPERCTLEPGDGLLLYTDGVTEAQDPQGRLFGETALAAALAQGGEEPLAAVVDAVRAFEAGAPQADDITCVWLQWQPVPVDREGPADELRDGAQALSAASTAAG